MQEAESIREKRNQSIDFTNENVARKETEQPVLLPLDLNSVRCDDKDTK